MRATTSNSFDEEPGSPNEKTLYIARKLDKLAVRMLYKVHFNMSHKYGESKDHQT